MAFSDICVFLIEQFPNMKKSTLLFALVLIMSCADNADNELLPVLSQIDGIDGKAAYLQSPYVTAGNRVYMVGHQNGTFPEIGWHIKGEMGGIWNHPIKLMDGFDVALRFDNTSFGLDAAEQFTNYPFANTHRFLIEDKQLVIERLQFVPDDTEGLVIEITVMNNGETNQAFELDFIGHSDLSPTWLGERTDLIDSEDQAEFDDGIGGWVIKDDQNPWYAIFAADQPPTAHDRTDSEYQGKGTSGSLSYNMQLSPGQQQSITFAIAGSYSDEKAARNTLRTLFDDRVSLLEAKRKRYQDLAQRTKLTIPDKHLERTFEWLKYNCDWLIREVPEIGSGITAGIPDYPWWFGVDSEYALQGYMAIGQTEAVYNTIALLDSVSNAVNGNGKIIHEMSTNGAVFNPGNINETPQFASLIWNTYLWNGDREFLARYFPTVKKGLHWLLSENDTDGNLFPEGFGMMEIHGLDSEMIDVAAYTQKAFHDAAMMAKELGETELSDSYAKTATALAERINSSFWSEDFGSFADFIGTDEQALHLIEDAIVRADTLNKPWAIEELEATRNFIKANPSDHPRPFVMHHNWVVNTPMEMGIADSSKAVRALEVAERFVNPFGVFVTGIDRDASAGSDDGSFQGSKIFSYTGAVMTLPTGVQAISENNYGRPDKALNYWNRMARTFSYALPGSMYEVSPDYGMITQAWNIYSFAYPIVHQFFGLRPYAAKKEIIIDPLMPSDWDEASLENIQVAENSISIQYKKANRKTTLIIQKTDPDWIMKIKVPDSGSASLNYTNGTLSENILETKANEVEISYGSE